MSNKITLTASQIRYLLALKKLNSSDGIRGSDIAVELGLSKPSVHNMMDTFIELDFIEKEPGGQVFMTEYGLYTASEYEGYFKKVKKKLSSQTAMDISLDIAICAFLAELSEQCLGALSQVAV